MGLHKHISSPGVFPSCSSNSDFPSCLDQSFPSTISQPSILPVNLQQVVIALVLRLLGTEQTTSHVNLFVHITWTHQDTKGRGRHMFLHFTPWRRSSHCNEANNSIQQKPKTNTHNETNHACVCLLCSLETLIDGINDALADPFDGEPVEKDFKDGLGVGL